MRIIQHGLLKVDDIHKIYYENCGNSNGEHVLFLHGGPGLGFSDSDKVFFDPDRINLILFDQRGCGRSLPKRALENNTTNDLIADIIKLLDHLNIDRVILFGGSWGSTLALLFAIAHPDRVKGMVLRGVFTATRKERRYFEEGGTKSFFPEVWKRYEEMVPLTERKNTSAYYFDQILSSDGELRKKLAYELAYYGMSVSGKRTKTGEIEVMLNNSDYETRAIILSHYTKNIFFIPDNYILDNAEKMGDIPVHIVHGRYDMICPPAIAFALREKLKNSELILPEGGHSPGEKEMKKALVSELDKLIDFLN